MKFPYALMIGFLLFIVVSAATRMVYVKNHEFVSEDGGFVMETGPKRPLRIIEHHFETYKFLREQPTMPLYRTTRLSFNDLTSKSIKYRYNETIRKSPVDWRLQLREKCIKEYIPTLPIAAENEEVKLFFFNQYDDAAINIHGISRGKVFGIRLRERKSPVWCYTKEIDIQEEHWRNIWQFVRTNQEHLISTWEKSGKDMRSKFQRGYDRTF